MVKFVDSNNQTTTYTYDDAGDRVKEVGPISGHNTTTTYLIDDNNPMGYAQAVEEHVNGAATPSITYFVGPNGTQGQTAGSTVIYMLRITAAMPAHLHHASGTVTQYDQYDAYGNQIHSNNIPTTHYFPDGIDPASGLVFHIARQENTFNGEFIERDFGLQGQGKVRQPLSLNKYIYAGDNPIMYADPSGHDFSLSETLTAACVATLFTVLLGGATTYSALSSIDQGIAENNSVLPDAMVLNLGLSVAGGGFQGGGTASFLYDFSTRQPLYFVTGEIGLVPLSVFKAF